jgi:hypothetical protein
MPETDADPRTLREGDFVTWADNDGMRYSGTVTWTDGHMAEIDEELEIPGRPMVWHLRVFMLTRVQRVHRLLH